MDRRDNNADYGPGNIRMATRSRQMRNTRVANVVEYQGIRMSVADFRERFCPRFLWNHTVTRKLREGLTPDEVIAEQIHCKGRYRKKAADIRSSEERPA
jgi:hypothetical protein